MTNKPDPQKTTGGSLNVREVQPPHLTEKELKTDDQADKAKGARNDD